MENYKINLRTLFTLPYEDIRIPDWVESDNCIYRIINKINNKSYIGQARNFYGRLVRNLSFSHLSTFQHYCINNLKHIALYNALRKYGCINFDIEIIEYNLNQDNLNNHEIYWIKYYHTFVNWQNTNGYNMTTGGQNCEHLHSIESRKKAIEVTLNRYGILPFNSDESRKKSYETRLKIYGEVFPYAHTEESIKKRLNSDRINHGGVLGWHTKEARELAYNSLIRYKEDHGYYPTGGPNYQTSLDTKASIYNGDCAGQLHTEEVYKKVKMTRMINNIITHFNQLIDKGYDITAYNYAYHTDDYNTLRQHVPNVIRRLDELRSDIRWTYLMELIFSKFINNLDTTGFLIESYHN